MLELKVTVILLGFCIIAEANVLGNIFGAKKGDATADKSDNEDVSQKQDVVVSGGVTSAPLFPAIPHPDTHPLHHNNNPNHPFNNNPFSNFNGPRPTIVATKTVYVEVTSKVIQHPICIEVHGVKPPCLPHIEDHFGYDNGQGYYQENEHGFSNGYNPGFFREGGQEIEINNFQIKPTAVMEMAEPTRILGGVTETAAAPSEYPEEEEEGVDEQDRKGRYLKIHGATPVAPLRAESEIVDSSDSGIQESRLLENLLNRQPEYHYATKTLWVTKVEKHINHKVTATLQVQNCIPHDFHYPICHKPHYDHHYSHKPVYNEHHEPEHHETEHHEPVHHKPVHYEHHEPVHHKPVHHKPVHHEPVHHKPVHHEPIDHKPVHHEPVHHKPVHHEPIHHKPVHHEPDHHKPVHEYQQPIHHETQYNHGHEVNFQGVNGVLGATKNQWNESDNKNVPEEKSAE